METITILVIYFRRWLFTVVVGPCKTMGEMETFIETDYEVVAADRICHTARLISNLNPNG